MTFHDKKQRWGRVGRAYLKFLPVCCLGVITSIIFLPPYSVGCTFSSHAFEMDYRVAVLDILKALMCHCVYHTLHEPSFLAAVDRSPAYVTQD